MYIHRSDGRWIIAHEQYQRHLLILDVTKFKKDVVTWSYKNFIDFTIISDTEFIAIESAKPDFEKYTTTHWKYFHG